MAKKSKSTQKRVQDIADELAQAAGRLREALDEVRPATTAELDIVRAEIKALASRVSKLEGAPAKRAPAAKTTTRRSTAASATAASRVPAARAAAKKRSSLAVRRSPARQHDEAPGGAPS